VGLVADAAGGAVVVVDAHWVILGIEAVPARIIHKLAVVIGAKVAGLARVVVALLLPSSMTPRSSHVGLPWMLLPSLSVLLSSPCTVLHLMSLSGVVWSFWGTYACSGFVIGVASPFLILEISACSCIWRLFGLASVASD